MKTVQWSVILLTMVATVATSGRVSAQDALDVLSDTTGPMVPFLAEPIEPRPAARLQTHFLPLSDANTDLSTFQMPFLFAGSWNFSGSVIGEASLPMILTFPEEGDTGFDIGNVKIGIEAPVMIEGARHRWTVSFDLFLPFSQIGHGDETAEDLANAAVRRGRQAMAASVLPSLAPSLTAETFTPVLGTHYRFNESKFVTMVGFGIPLFLGFDFNALNFFNDNHVGLRYDLAFGYDARPVFPTLELTGLTSFDDETATSLVTTLGIRGAFDNFEPGVAISYPIVVGNDAVESIVLAHIEFVYRFD